MDLLLSRGASVRATNDVGDTALTLARTSSQNENLLKKLQTYARKEDERRIAEETTRRRIREERERRRREEAEGGGSGEAGGLSAGVAFFPSLFGLQFQSLMLREDEGGISASQRGQQAQLTRVLLILGTCVLVFLLAF